MVYKLGETYYAAHSNEFGYAHYEVIPTPQIAINPLRTAMLPRSPNAGSWQIIGDCLGAMRSEGCGTAQPLGPG